MEADHQRGSESGRWGRVAVVALFALSLAFQLRVMDEAYLLGDEGIALMGGWRVSQGEVPNRDFFEIIPPVSFLPTAAIFKLFGTGVLQARLLVLAYSLLLLLLVDRILSRLGVQPLWRTLPLALLTPFGLFYWPVPSHHWVADLFLLAALLALLRAVEAPSSPNGTRLWGVTAGACTALCGLSLQDQGGYLALAVLLLLLPWLPSAGGVRGRLTRCWAGGLAAVAGAAAIILVPLVGLGELVRQWVVFPATRYKNIGTNTSKFFFGWEGVANLWASPDLSARPLFVVSLTVCAFFLFALPLLAVGALALLWRLDPARRLSLGIVTAGVVAVLGATAHRWALTNIVWAAPILLLPFTWFLSTAGRSPSPLRRRLATGSLVLLLLSAVVFSAAQYRRSQTATFAQLRSQAGSLRSVRLEETRSVQEALDAIDLHLPRGAPLFCNGYTPLINFLALRPNPTRFQFFYWPSYHTDAQAREVLAVLESRPETWVLLTRPVRPDSPVESLVLKHYRLVWQNEKAGLFGPPAPTETAPAPPATPRSATLP